MSSLVPSRRRAAVSRRAFALLAAVVLTGLLPLADRTSASGAAPVAAGSPPGYWMVATDGGVFSFGDAGFFGSTGDIALNRPIVGLAATPSGDGYWMVASDGGIFSFGDAGFFGSTGDIALNRPIVGMAATPGRSGYWLVASDGGLFAFGDAGFHGSAASIPGHTVTAMVVTPSGRGYWQMTTAGTVFAFGDAPSLGSGAGLNQRVVGAAGVPAPRGVPAGGGTGTPPITVSVRPPQPNPPTTAPSTRPPADKGPPDIVVIVLDDMRSEGTIDVAAVLPRTKQWLAQGGTTFTEGYATSPLCCPERATIWSGRLPHNHSVFDNQTGDSLDLDWIIPRYLRDAGYRTGLVGKFITNWKFRYEPPHFHDYAVFQGGYTDPPFWVKDPGATQRTTRRAAYSTDFIADKAVQYIAAYAAEDRPFYLHINPHAPHDGTAPSPVSSSVGLYEWPERHDHVPIPAWNPSPPVTLEADRSGKLDKPPYLRNKTLSYAAAEYTHMGHMRTLLAADEMVDRIMAELEATGRLDNTLVIFTSDNGFSWGERGVTSKGLPYREHVEVPFLVRWPGVFPAGATDPRPVGGEDILPTLLDAARYTPPTLGYRFDGRSFLPGRPSKPYKFLEFGPNGPSPDDYQGHRGIPAWASLRTADWQYIETYDKDNVTVAFTEYYDLRADPWQLENVLAGPPAGHPPNLAQLSATLQRQRSCVGTTGPAACP